MADDIFGGLFDFNFDGKTDSFELALGLQMIEEDDRKSRMFGRSCFDSGADIDLDDLDGIDPDDI